MTLSRPYFEIIRSGVSVPALTAAEYGTLVAKATSAFGIQPLQAAENAGRALSDLTVGLSESVNPASSSGAAGLRVLLLVGSGHAGLAATVAARHLANRGARVTVLLARRPKSMPELHRNLLSMLLVLGLEMQVADPADVDLYLSRTAAFDRVIDGLSGFDQGPDAVPAQDRAVLSAIAAAAGTASVPVVAVGLPLGVAPDTGAVGSPGIAAHTTLAIGMPLAGVALASAATGDVFLADVAYPPELLSEVGFPLPPLFAPGTLLALRRLTDSRA